MSDIRKVCVVTGSRAEYHLLYHIMKEILQSKRLRLQLLVTGMHLAKEFGETFKLIENDGFKIDRKIDLHISGDDPLHISRAMGTAIVGFSEAYQEIRPDILIVLGDRYEIFAAVSAALPFRIPVAHISGGETTEGAIDEQFRHAITKMSHIHFPGAAAYAENIIRMGEESWRVFNVGDPGIENIIKMKFKGRRELFEQLSLDPAKKTILATLHPTTLNTAETEKHESGIFFSVLKKYANCNIVITYPNSDANGKLIISEIENLRNLENVKISVNMGSQLYLNLMKYSDVVAGNSSSAITEAPVFKVPAINYGDRQKGRLMAKNIIQCSPDPSALKQVFEKALFDPEFREIADTAVSLYGAGNTSEEIVKVLENIEISRDLIRKKLVFK
jgi:GDP/UDP-N,N'-diacetylbacillosamine 2-epimerase (hydrolysing)